MKTGILTFHSAHNFGAALQAYAMQEFLKGMGCEPEFVNYLPDYVEDRKSAVGTPPIGSFSARKIAGWGLSALCALPILSALKRRERLFDAFTRQRLKLSAPFKNAAEFRGDYGAIFFGSDQIWNPLLTAGGDDFFLGNFKTPADTLKIGYAVSAGGYAREVASDKKFTDALSNFSAFSVREEELGRLLRPHFAKDIPELPDPSLLLPESAYEKILKAPKTSDRYVLVYELSPCAGIEKTARRIAKTLGAKVVRIKAKYSKDFLPLGHRIGIGPEEFLGLVKHAEYVLTTSFHGTAFSIVFKKDFHFVSMGMKNENRIVRLLSALGLQGCIAEKSAITRPSRIDWGPVCEKLGLLRERAARYTSGALENR